MLAAALLTIGMAALVAVTLSDLKRQIVPDQLVMLVAVSGLALRLWLAPSFAWLSLLVAALMLIALGRLAYHEWIGGGDAKLIAAVTLLVPADQVPALLLYVAFAGGAASVVYFVARFLRPGTWAIEAVSASPSPAAAQAVGRPAWMRRALLLAAGPMPYSLAVLGGIGSRFAIEAIQCSCATFYLS